MDVSGDQPRTWAGIRVCDDHSRIESGDVEARLERMIIDADEIGCEAALAKHDHDVRYLTDTSRAQYLDLLDIRDQDTVLEIGASMGQHTRLIAPRCKNVQALEVVPQQASFAKMWCTQSGCDNVDVTSGGASGRLPYESASVDIAVMNYVLEWSAGRSDTDPRSFHLFLLSEVNRVLRPGGRFFVSTKNRYSLMYLLGGFDEHLDFRFGSALPRSLQRALTRRRSGKRTPGFLHSRREFEALLRKAGFSGRAPFLFFPDARYPKAVVPFDRKQVRGLDRTLQDVALARRDRFYFALPWFLQRLTAMSHAFIAVK